MRASREQLEQEAELLLALYNDPSAQRQRLQAIESQLRAQGGCSTRLHQQIERLCAEADPALYRCSYRFLPN